MSSDLVQRLTERAERLVLEAFPGSTLEFVERGPDRTPRWLLYRAYWLIERNWEQRWIWCSPAEAAPLIRPWWKQ
jgi:hypothetical protein